MKVFAILISITLLAGGVFFYMRGASAPIDNELASTTIDKSGTADAEIVGTDPTFMWVYDEVSVNEGMPTTRISLTARYTEGTSETKVIDTIEGACNTYVEPDADVYEKSEMIICYYAGLGHYFKVVESGAQYFVQRKVFEEGSPDYNPPAQEFETVATF